MSVKNKLIRWAVFRWLDGQAKEKTMIGKIWVWLDGKKTAIGLGLIAAGKLAIALPAVLAAVGVEPATNALYTGYFVAAVGAAHKAYKFIYKTDAPSE